MTRHNRSAWLWGMGVLLWIGSRTAGAQYYGYAPPHPAPGMISVQADGEVRIPPDEVLLTLGVETDDMVLEQAHRKNSEIIQRAIDSIKRQGVLPRHIQTDYLNIEPRYLHENPRREFLGYFVRKTIVVTLKNVRVFDALLQQAVKDGVNYVLGIQFRTTQLAKHREAARELAIRLAMRKAAQLARATGQTLGPPRSINEQNNNWNYYGYYGNNMGWGQRASGYMAQSYGGGGFGGNASSGTGSFEPGQVVVSSNVIATFDLLEKRSVPTTAKTKPRRAPRAKKPAR